MSASVRVHWNAGPRLATSAELRRAVQAARAHGARPELAIGVIVVAQEQLRALHEQWLDDPTPTDVITFDLSDDVDGPAGELYVSAEQAELVARRRAISARDELLRYAIHGVLHLCGYDDRESRQRARMRRAERAVLAELALARRRKPARRRG